MSVVTRFAPSPTGILHIGNARTALFNWLYARHCGGRFLLRIEDTDRERSTDAAIDTIFDGLDWLGLDRDGETVHQSARAERHREVAGALLERGRAYRCYCTPEELQTMREERRAAGLPMRYDGRWRDRDPAEAPAGADYTVRLKMPQTGATAITDQVQGTVTLQNEQLDDMILLRADGTPTYMLSVVVDDHDMAVDHVIRGDDHLNNMFRQHQLYLAMDWTPPRFAHIPLIHGPDGKKLSKRHGALGVAAWRDMGYLPEALRNYLARLGWSHGNEEIFSTEEAIGWFDITDVGRAAARLDFAKLADVNRHYLRAADNGRLTALLRPLIAERLEAAALSPEADARLPVAMEGLKSRADTLNQLADNALFYLRRRPISIDAAAKALLNPDALAYLGPLAGDLVALEDWTMAEIETCVRHHAARLEIKLGRLAQPLRAAMTGATSSPGIFEIMAILGRDEVLGRLADIGASPSHADNAPPPPSPVANTIPGGQ